MSSNQQTWTSASGSVERINYEVDEDMSGIIAPDGAGLITLIFDSFDAELGYDFLTVKSCTTNDCSETSVLGEYTGSTIPSPVKSNTGIMLIEWWSDEIITRTGWSAHWSSGMPVDAISHSPMRDNIHFLLTMHIQSRSVTGNRTLPYTPAKHTTQHMQTRCDAQSITNTHPRDSPVQVLLVAINAWRAPTLA
jgi:hypothetical protein